MKERIPKQFKENVSKRIPQPFEPSIRKINFSFELLDFNDYFSLSGTCVSWSYDLFCMMKEISKLCPNELFSHRFRTYRFHTHENIQPPVPWPPNIKSADASQIRISKSKGGIHGIFVENTFYVFWLDPLHNMYPDENYGGLRKIVQPKTCCTEKDDIIKDLGNKVKEYEELLDKETKPRE